MGAAEDAYDQQRRVREYVARTNREKRIADAKRRVPSLLPKALANLKNNHYPEKLGVGSRMVNVGGKRRVGWELKVPMTGSEDWNRDPEPGFLLLGEGELVRCDTSYNCVEIRLRDLGGYVVDVAWGLERMVAFPYEPGKRPLWHRLFG